MPENRPAHIAAFRDRYEKLLRLIRRNKEIRDYSKMRNAYDLLVNRLGDQDDPVRGQVISAIEVAEIAVNEIGLGMTSVLSIFLMYVLRKGGLGIPEIEKEFGKPVAVITGGLHSIHELGNKTMAPQAENYRNLLLNLPGMSVLS